MPDQHDTPGDPEPLRLRALARWENEGGSQSFASHPGATAGDGSLRVPALTNAELSQLHIRVIALEGLVTALLVDASERQLALVREMSRYISPRPGFTDHPLTLRAATQMVDLVERACRFRDVPRPE